MKNPAFLFFSPSLQGEEDKHPVSELLRQCRRAFGFVAVVTLLTETLSVTPILYMMNMYDKVLSSRSQVTLISLTVLIIAIYCFWSALEWIRTRMLIRISLRIDWDLASQAFDASFRRYVGRKQVNVHQVLGDVVQLRQFLTGSSLLALISAPYAIVFMIVGAFFHPYLALFIVVASAMLLAVTFMTNRLTTPVLRAANDSQAEANRLAAQSLRLSETALALGMLPALRRRWYEKHQGFLRMQAEASEASGLLGGASGFLTKAFPSLQMALGIYLATENLITGGMVIAATFLISKSVSPIQKVIGSWKDITSSRQALERLDQLIAEDEQQQRRMSLPTPVGNLTVESLVAIPAGAKKPVIQGISFAARPGQITAVIGPSASGKSSLIRLLLGIWRPTRGSVRLDGAEISDWIRDNAGEWLGYVPQDIEFFEGTVAENIARLGAVDAEKVVTAAKEAGIHELILSFPDGYETKLGETGHSLTGGQKQRLAVARALYGSPNFVVMDEPNANLDEQGERALNQTLRALRARGANVIFTTHRPQLIGVADYVLVLKEGQQVTFGPIAEVFAALKKTVDEKSENAPSDAPASAVVAAAA